MLTKTNEIRIETSTMCNFNCDMCARSTLRRKKEFMSNELFEFIIDKVKKELNGISAVTLSGFGEFSTDPFWKEKLYKGKSYFDKVHIVTNLSLFSVEDLEFIIKYSSDIRISVYGLSDEVYRKVHHPPEKVKYKDLENRIHFLINHKHHDQKIILNYIESQINSIQTQEWINYWEDKVDLIEVWKPHNWIDSKKYRPLSENRLKTCGRPFNGPIQVQVDGTINVCCFDYNGEMIIGDLKIQSFNEVFNSKEMRNIQNLHENGRADDLKLCSVCDQRNSLEFNANYLIYNSKFDKLERIGTTSTEYHKVSN